MKRKPILNNLYIESVSSDGRGVAKYNDKVYFIDQTVRGDDVNAQITRGKSGYGEGYVLELNKVSDYRKVADCKYFGVCGGCKFQHITYQEQLYIKNKIVTDALQRIGKVDVQQYLPIIGADNAMQYYYRNKMEYAFSDKRWLRKEELQAKDLVESHNGLGFHVKGLFDKVVDIDYCYLQHDLGNHIRNMIRTVSLKNEIPFFNPRTKEGLLRSVILRNTTANEWMVILVMNYEEQHTLDLIFNELIVHFPQIVSFNYIINSKVNDSIFDLPVHRYSGSNYLIETFGNTKYKISPKSFFQTNSYQGLKLFTAVKNLITESDITLYDLYCGAGSISCFVADKCKKVVGIEEIADAIDDAHFNAELNKLKNAIYLVGDCKKILNTSFVESYGKADVIITDPPRAGMHDDVVKTLLAFESKKIIYVSCNPSTQARDLQLLSEKYNCVSSQAVDMFPQTHHVENIVLLELK